MERSNQGAQEGGRRRRHLPPGGTISGGTAAADVKLRKAKISLGQLEKVGVKLDVVFPPCQVTLVRCDPQVAELLQNRRSLRRRRKQSTSNFRCSICGKGHASRSSMYYHRKLHLGKPFKCVRCGKAFLKRPMLLRHITSHTGEKAYRCSACGKRFQYLEELKKHTRRVDLCKDGDVAYRKKAYKEPRFPCGTCGRSFVLKTDLANHVGYHRDTSVERALTKKRRQR